MNVVFDMSSVKNRKVRKVPKDIMKEIVDLVRDFVKNVSLSEGDEIEVKSIRKVVKFFDDYEHYVDVYDVKMDMDFVKATIVISTQVICYGYGDNERCYNDYLKIRFEADLEVGKLKIKVETNVKRPYHLLSTLRYAIEILKNIVKTIST